MGVRNHPLPWVRILLPALFIVILGRAAVARADDPSPPPATEELPPRPGLSETMSVIEKTVTETHDHIERKILERVIAFDNFFGNTKTEDQRRTRYELRWRNGIRIDESGHTSFSTTARANFVLSRISERLRVSITGEDQTEPPNQNLPEDPGTPGFDRTTRNARLVNTELRYGLLKTSDMEWFLGTGIQVRIPPDLFMRTRFQYTRNLSDTALFRVRETLFLKNTSGPGETTELDIEQLLSRDAVLRHSTSGTASSDTHGIEWGSELSLIHRLSATSAVTLTGGVYGNTSDIALISNYKVLTRYRRNFLRPWLFYELAPEISWPRKPDGSRDSELAITALLEVVFQGSSPPPAPP